MLSGFFGNLIARMLCGNHLSHFIESQGYIAGKIRDPVIRVSRLEPKQIIGGVRDQPVSRRSRKSLKPVKPFVKLRPAYFINLVFSYVVKGIKRFQDFREVGPRGSYY